jgi:vesicle coat complex subunit
MILKELCENLKSIDDPNAKASMIWIIGEYVETIENADELLFNFSESFKDDPPVV